MSAAASEFQSERLRVKLLLELLHEYSFLLHHSTTNLQHPIDIGPHAHKLTCERFEFGTLVDRCCMLHLRFKVNTRASSSMGLSRPR